MSLFVELFDRIEENKTKEWFGIPFNFGQLDEFIPYIEKNRMFLVFAASGAGKTKFTLNKFVLTPYLFSRETGYDLKIIYLSLEVPRIDVMGGITSYLYAKEFGVKKEKEFFIREKVEDVSVIVGLHSIKEKYSDLDDKVLVIEGLKNHTQILKTLNEDLKEYKEKSPNTHFIIITDTINALKAPPHLRSGVIAEYTSGCKTLMDNYQCTIVNIQQQSKLSEQSAFTYKGGRIEQKTLPDRSALKWNTDTFDDADYVMSLYSPSLYGIPHYPFDGRDKYNMEIWGDNFRRLCVEKSRHGKGQREMNVYFDGRINHFAPLPPPNDKMNNIKIVENLNSDG